MLCMLARRASSEILIAARRHFFTMEHASMQVKVALMSAVEKLVALMAPTIPFEIKHSRKRGGHHKAALGRNNTPLVVSALDSDGKTIARER